MPSPLTTQPPKLNLPLADLPLRAGAKGVEVYDRLRRKWLVLTHEEWVRQQFVSYMIDCLGYPPSLMANEVGISLNDTSRRCDTVVYSHGLRPLMIVEYKATTVRIDRRVFEQVARYNLVLGVPYLVVSNGLSHYCMRVDSSTGRCELLGAIPRYQDML